MRNIFNKCLLLGLGVIAFACTDSGQKRISEVRGEADEFEQYAKAEFTIELRANWNDPYVSSDVALDMVLQSPSGQDIVLPAFYVSGNSGENSTWKARFMAKEIGKYNYSFKLYEKGELITTSKRRSFVSVESDRKGILSPNDNWTFKYDNGELFRGVGENICWEARSNDDNRYLKELHENPRFNYDYLLTSLAENGGNFFRTWMVYWNLPVDWKIVRNTDRYVNSDARLNESGIQRMDELVDLCDSLDIHFMLALETHGGLMDRGWEISSYNVKQGGPAETPYEFFSLEEARAMYKDKLRFMVARWGYSPAIGAWEFFNEVDNAMFNGPEESQLPHDIVTDWHAEMSEYLKEIDFFGHLVTTSVSHRDIDGLKEIPFIDFNQKHIYRGTQTIPGVINEYVDRYSKPYVIGEFGYEWDWHVNFYDIADEKISDYKRGLWYGLFSPTPIMPMSWWWEFFDELGIRYYLANVQVINKLMIDEGRGSFEQVSAHVSKDELVNYAVKSGDTYFVYLYNPTGISLETEVLVSVSSVGSYQVKVFNCETGDFNQLGKRERRNDVLVIDQLNLPAGSDIVLVIGE